MGYEQWGSHYLLPSDFMWDLLCITRLRRSGQSTRQRERQSTVTVFFCRCWRPFAYCWPWWMRMESCDHIVLQQIILLSEYGFTTQYYTNIPAWDTNNGPWTTEPCGGSNPEFWCDERTLYLVGYSSPPQLKTSIKYHVIDIWMTCQYHIHLFYL